MDYNIILITLDGLRSDRLSSSSSLMKIQEKSLFYNNLITVAPYTLASLHAIFSGMYPKDNGVNAYYRMSKFKENEIETITQLLQKNGYYTSCDIIHDAIIPKKGFDERNVFDEESVDFKERHSNLIKKLSEKKKFFLFLHYTEPHKNLVKELNKDKVKDEYSEVKRNSKEEEDDFFSSIEKNEKRYDSYMPELDAYVKKIHKTIIESGIEEKTILIFHADHGTSLGEKIGEKFYGVFVYDYTIKVFAIIKIPGQKPEIINTQCQTIDIFPTIAELAKIDLTNSSKTQGISLLDLLNDKKNNERVSYVETGGLYGPWPSPTEHNIFCIRHKNKKLIYNKTPKTWEFYDLEKDEHEKNNIYEKDSELIKNYKEKLVNHFDKLDFID
tara:strand:- start:3971 stop:5125 length:1155 start_codon:yes stop_codon:yes gene_type:complete